MGNITIQGDITATVPGNAVGGASALTTVGSIPFVTSAGVLGQDADFSFGSATDRMIVGNASVGSNAAAYTGYAVWAHKDQQSAAGIALLQGPSGDTYLNSAAAAALVFRIGATEGFRLAPTTRNLLIGTTTDDGTNRLQVAGSARLATTANGTPVALTLSATGTGSDATVDTVGSGAYMHLRSTLASPYAGTQINKSTNTVLWFTGTQGLDTYGWFTGSSLTRLASLTTGGTFTLYNETPTTGSTSLVVRAGAGQSTNNLTTWQNAAGTLMASVASSGGFSSVDGFFGVQSGGSFLVGLQANGVNLNNVRPVAWSSTGDINGVKDVALYRNAAGVIEVNNGTAGTFRDILARRVQSAGETVANLPAAAAGNAGTITYITDANATTIGSTVAGGGSNKVLVWSDGTAWKIFAS